MSCYIPVTEVWPLLAAIVFLLLAEPKNPGCQASRAVPVMGGGKHYSLIARVIHLFLRLCYPCDYKGIAKPVSTAIHKRPTGPRPLCPIVGKITYHVHLL